MNIWLILMIAIAIIIIGLLVFMIITRRKTEQTPNYRSWLFIGICWIPLGIATKNLFFYIMGMVFIIVSLVNKNKWREEKKWIDLSPAEKRLKIILMCVVAILLITLVFFFFVRRHIIT